MTPELDLLIQNATIVDGTGGKPIKSNVGISAGRIIQIGKNFSADSKTMIDAEGLVVSPGFIDIHSHSDMSIPFDNRLESMIRQGITTSVVGNCGSSLAPIDDKTIDVMQKDFDVFSPPGHKLDITWRSFGEYIETISKIPLNIALLVGFGTIRVASGPGFENREPTKKELAEMKASVAEAMEVGAFGLSTGLFYAPQSFASTNEVIELAKVVAQYNGLYFSHIRGEGASVVQAVQELIDIVDKSGCRGGQIAHHKIAGKPYWGKSRETLKLIEDANNRGLYITCDQYPYNRGMTSIISLLPPWVHEGGMDGLLDHLRSLESQKRIMNDIKKGIEGWENIIKEIGWKHIFVASTKTEKWKSAQGKDFNQLAKELGYSHEFLLLFQLLLDESGEGSMTIESMNEDEIRIIMRNKYTMVATDGWGISPTGVFSYAKPHPRSYGTYPRILGKYVREEGLLTLEEAVRKMTGFPAEKLRLRDRGLICEGYWADVVVFDPKAIRDRATFLDPHQFPVGISNVIVNGELVVSNDTQLDTFPGVVLRHKP